MPLHLTTDENDWDDFALANGGCFLQSWGWSRFQEAVGNEVFRVRVGVPGGEGSAAQAVAQFTVVSLKLPLGQKVAYVPRGPLVASGDNGVRGNFRACLGAVNEAARRLGAAFTRLEPPWPLAAAPLAAEDLAAFGLLHARHVAPDCTSVVDLTLTEDELLAAMRQKTRYNIRLAERHGVTVSEAEYENAHLLKHDVEVFWKMLSATAERDVFSTHDRHYYGKMVDALKPRRQPARLSVRLVFAMHEGEAAAAGIFAEYGDTVTYLHGASFGHKRAVMAPFLLHWEVMKEAKRRGFAKYDFWGVAPTDDGDHPWAGITRFKTGFGGERVAYLGTWEMPRSQWAYRLYRAARAIRGR
jgi:lipid II:glycine glycyltransferase (peptidoglycan interpeptide bridge formation enzyme)